MLDTLLVSNAYAQAAAGAPASPLSGILPLVFIFVVFYFLLIRPQQKKYKAHQAMIDAVEKGDDIVTGGGIHGKVIKVDDSTATVKIADEVDIKIERSTISNVLTQKEKKDA